MSRTFGWVQNPNRLETLKYITGIFQKDSDSNIDLRTNRLPKLLEYRFITREHYDQFILELSKEKIEISYDLLKGKGLNGAKSRKDAICTGIVQAAIDAHSSSKFIVREDGNEEKIKKPYVDDWTADGYLRWAVSTGLIKHSPSTDSCKITDLGVRLVHAKDTVEEQEVFTQALLSYPPVYRVLEILSDQKPKTKFEIGAQLGFQGEMGFTSIPQEIFVYDYSTAPAAKQQDIKQNEEGDSDKYARTIANWLSQMKWVKPMYKDVTETYLGTTYTITLRAWQITRAGELALKKSKGGSSNARIPKIVKFEMLATKVPNANYIRLRRAQILNSLKTGKTIASIQQYLHGSGITETESVIQDELDNFQNIGITISKDGGKYKLVDIIIGLEILPSPSAIRKEHITELKDKIRKKLHHISHSYLLLVDLAYSDADTKAKKNLEAKEFEIQTAKLFTKELDFSGSRLGDSNRPDVILSYGTQGTIIDNKSYKDGFNLDAGCRDEMSRYIEENQQRIPGVPSNEWWKSFDPSVTDFTFLFVTSYLKGNFKKGLSYISTMRKIQGACVNVENLLYLAENIKSGKTSYTEFFSLFNNEEIVIGS
ncbi:Type-2 restriction enzyme FokI [uncultured Ruminococcus sp.]|uniref:Restriction endonuclease n=1 Tax=Massiliimalia timonensis TaxID=1987501 RepID=A0A8J6TVX0_9FIRM|nr:restriction endonuclease FokI C-terminal domain-containing protein [Massiliimalia timonensis]MBC8611818.1 restriction endonuclease [Massiliimalia timonensis]SCH53413.1 Type-2 restriction enzyme FokI [uncultured Clostridium sp.]SCH63980.1 Type-2 restriction enzyme FokI [uncultured Ruminococcus sp.]